MCIDATSSMGPYINDAKKMALRFDEVIRNELAKKEKRVDQLRAKLIIFRDIGNDGLDEALLESDFLNLPDENETFRDYINQIVPKGGGDEPENSLEAIARAMNSSWTKEGDKRRHLIVMFTDAAAHPLEKSGSIKGNYPEDMPSSFEEFVDMWEGQVMDDKSKRMLIFAPHKYPWRNVAETCDEVFWIESNAGKGLSDIHFDEIFKGIVNSI
jgi:hypothetical protein